MKTKILSTALILCAISFVQSQEINAPKFGKGLFNLVGQDSTWTMKVGGYKCYLPQTGIMKETN